MTDVKFWVLDAFRRRFLVNNALCFKSQKTRTFFGYLIIKNCKLSYMIKQCRLRIIPAQILLYAGAGPPPSLKIKLPPLPTHVLQGTSFAREINTDAPPSPPHFHAATDLYPNPPAPFCVEARNEQSTQSVLVSFFSNSEYIKVYSATLSWQMLMRMQAPGPNRARQARVKQPRASGQPTPRR